MPKIGRKQMYTGAEFMFLAGGRPGELQKAV